MFNMFNVRKKSNICYFMQNKYDFYFIFNRVEVICNFFFNFRIIC